MGRLSSPLSMRRRVETARLGVVTASARGSASLGPVSWPACPLPAAVNCQSWGSVSVSVLETRNLLDHFLALHENAFKVKSCFVAPERKFNKPSSCQLVEAPRPGLPGRECCRRRLLSAPSARAALSLTSVRAGEVRIKLTRNKPSLSSPILTRGDLWISRHSCRVF